MKATFLSRFTPSLMTPEALEALFVQREDLARRISERIRESTLTPSKHHTLLIGPRGIGKTHLISLIYYRIQAMDDLRDRLRIAWLREEEWGVTSFLDLLLRIFRALLGEYGEVLPVERIESLYKLQPTAAERAGAALLKEFVGNRTLLVLVENLDDLFKGLGDKGQKRLRAYLQENPFCTIVATSQSLFNGVSLQTSPFYGFFRIHHLEELTLEDATRLLTNIANLEGDHELASFISTPLGRARIRAVHHLAGGNHRVYVIFSQFLTRESLDEFVDPFMRTLDDLTPYYQARMAWLSPQQRKIVEFLCDRRHAVPVKAIAQRCFLTHQIASSQLKTLRDMGYVHSESVGRESYYELHEPLMRLCIEVKKNRGEPIRLFVDFLRLWYSRAELQQRLELLQPDAALEREYLLNALQETKEEVEDPRVAACLKDLLVYHGKGDFIHGLLVAEELVEIRGQVRDWLEQGHYLDHLGHLNEALRSFDKVVELDTNSVPGWGVRGEVLDKLGRLDEALASFERVVELNPSSARAWGRLGRVLSKLGRLSEALTAFEKMIELNPSNAGAWQNRGGTLGDLGRLDEALAAFDKVTELDPRNTAAWYNRCWVLDKLERLDEALAAINKAIELDPNYRLGWHKRAMILDELGRLDEALASCHKAIELGDQSPHVFFKRAELLLALNNWNEGSVALDDALSRFAHVSEPDEGDTEAIVRNLFAGSHDAATWRTRITILIELYDKYEVLSALGQGLAGSISALTSPTVSDAATRTWRDIWQELTGNRKEFELPLRLLDAAIRYRETHDPRILLELPVEERKLLEPLLEQPQTASSVMQR